jgi:CxxC motif-containing protein (DUF1111 family)
MRTMIHRRETPPRKKESRIRKPFLLRSHISSFAAISLLALLFFSSSALGNRAGRAVPAAKVVPSGAPILESINVTPANPTLPIGAKMQFFATGVYSDGSTQDLTSSVAWNADEDVNAASLSLTGLATGVAQGSLAIKAISGLVLGSTTLTVTAATMSSISITPSSLSVVVGGKQQYLATGNFTDGTTTNLTSTATWKSSSPSVASITNGGLASGIVLGGTTISATSGAFTGSTPLTIGPPTLLSIAVTPNFAAIPTGTTQQYAATGSYSDGTTQNLTNQATWSCTSPNRALHINNFTGFKGIASAGKMGSGTIKATLGSIAGATPVNVVTPGLQSIAITPATVTIPMGGVYQFTATGTFAGGITQNITSTVSWSSSSTTIATVGSALISPGLAATLQVGTVTVSATEDGVSASTQLAVAPSLGGFLPGLNGLEGRMITNPITGGLALFDLLWKSTPDGFGPLYTKPGCSQCHSTPVPGGAGSVQVTRFGKLNPDGSFNTLENEGGPVLHPNSIGAQPLQSFQFLPGCSLPANSIPADATIISLRQSPPVFGDGFIDAIADSTIIANQTFQANDPTSQALGIHGVANMIPDLAGVTRPGRFGWKAQQATLLGFSGEAERFELGISDPEFPTETQPQSGTIPASCEVARSSPNDPPGLDNNLSVNFAAFAAFLAPPTPAPPTTTTIAGQASFVAAGCANCHVESMQTQSAFQVPQDYPVPLGSGAVETSDVLSNQTANLFSDLLIHDMGTALNDSTPQGQASGRQWRTTPLWGLSHKLFLIHDGRCTGSNAISCAIQAHGGEAAKVLANFNALSPTDQANVLAFLGSL